MIADSKTIVGDRHHREIMCIPYFFGNGFTYFGVKSDNDGKVLSAPVFEVDGGETSERVAKILKMANEESQEISPFKVGTITVRDHQGKERQITAYLRYIEKADINTTPVSETVQFTWVHTREICARMSPLDIKMVSTIVSSIGKRVKGTIEVGEQGIVLRSHFSFSNQTINWLRRRAVPKMLRVRHTTYRTPAI